MIAWSFRLAVCHAIALAAIGLAPDSALAQGKVDARYSATLGGIPIGRGAWVIDIGEDRYTAAAHGMTAGVMRIFTSGHGTSASRGAVAGGQPVPASFASSITTERRTTCLTSQAYPDDSFWKPQLKPRKNVCTGHMSGLDRRRASCGFKRSAQSAGDSVSETISEMTVAPAIVKANCR